KQDVYFRLQLKDLVKRQNAAQALRGMFPKRHVSILAEDTRHGYDHAVAQVNMSAPRVSKATIIAHAFRKGPKVYLLLMWCKRGELDRWRADFRAIAESFGPYDPARDGHVPRIALHVWQPGDTWRKLAEAAGMILGPFTAERLAALNGMDAKTSPAPGWLVKTVR
ncbi:MAG: hypothetical protein R8K47_01775, partial [Mariprofundaceae bacterium]